MSLSINNDNYIEEVIGCEKPVIIDFWAEWCGPCRMMSPVVEEIAEEHPELKVCKVNVDEARELAQKFNISAIPTIVMVKNGEQSAVSVGYKSKEELLAELMG